MLLWDIFPALLGFFLGTVLGSFSSALIWRIPLRIPWIYDVDKQGRFAGFVRSRCPHCSHILQPLDLIPLVSWGANKGYCRYCRKSIGILYPFLEFLAGLLGVVLFILFGLTILSMAALFFLFFLIVFFWIGFVHRFWSRDVLFLVLFVAFVAIFLKIFTGF